MTTSPKKRVLIADDDHSIQQYLSTYMCSLGFKTECVDSGDLVMPRLNSQVPTSLLLLDLLMPKTGGLDVLAQMKKLEHPVPTIVLSAMTDVSTVVQAMKMGASNYLAKPFKDEQLEEAIHAAVGSTSHAGEPTCGHSGSFGGDVTLQSGKIRHIREVATRIADTEFPVLILGESGVGKEVVARFIHNQSRRAKEPFVRVNCAALPSDLFESEVFGYDSGAFTGALHQKPGKFELAGNGTIVLDEIGELNPRLQAKLLHILQDGEFSRLGGVRTLRLQARVLALTNRNLEKAVASGEFREDLYFRLNVIRFDIPPLRERPEDIPILCRHFVEKHRQQHDHSVPNLPEKLLQALCQYSWPGNVRQLENVLKRFLILGDLDTLLSELGRTPPITDSAVEPGRSLKDCSSHAAEQAERELVFRTLEQTKWNRKLAARQLNICYKSLLNKLNRWEMADNQAGFNPVVTD
ncbi:MAG: two component, sigma54 specific, transcriptional regulator, Fis family [Bryobacterales bacterium]|nr:two component, sigma54 specific, transcriptional regulator, Fis family [Bryobacterales bacterium]